MTYSNSCMFQHLVFVFCFMVSQAMMADRGPLSSLIFVGCSYKTWASFETYHTSIHVARKHVWESWVARWFDCQLITRGITSFSMGSTLTTPKKTQPAVFIGSGVQKLSGSSEKAFMLAIWSDCQIVAKHHNVQHVFAQQTQ